MSLNKLTKSDKKSLLLKATFLLFAAVVLAGCAIHPSLIHPSVNSADTAYAKMNLDLSRKILKRVLADSSTTIDDRHSAIKRLAIQDWKFYKDYDSAKTRLQDALQLGFKQSETWQALSRIERESGHYRQARSAARRGIETAESESQKNASRLLFGRAVHDQLIENFREKKELDEKLLDEGHRMLTEVLAVEPGQPDASMFLLGISILRRDGPTALKAWRFYFHIPSDQSATGVLEKPGKTLDYLLPRREGDNLSEGELRRVALALGQSRMYEYAALVAAGVQGPDSDCETGIREILVYEDFIRNMKHITDEYYRQLAVGNAKGSLLWGLERLGKEKAYKRTLMRKAIDLWEQLPFADEKPEFHFNRFQDEVRKRFGAEVLAGWSGNYKGYVLQMGHCVVDETIRIEQYGYEADIRSIFLDTMVSNGYSSWFWDGEWMIGGWAMGSTIAEVRRPGLLTAFYLWRIITDPQERKKEEELIEKETALDESLARDNPYGFLPGLARRLRLNAARRIYDSVKAQGYEGDDLCVAFVAEVVRLHREYMTIGHEGRHAIDRLHFPEEFKRWSSAEREFRAKLSQVAFASDPAFAVRNIFSRLVGHSTSHGQADERIMKLIVEWMRAQTDEIAGIDPSRPMLSQFDLLSDDQIRTFFRGLDPLASHQKAVHN